MNLISIVIIASLIVFAAFFIRGMTGFANSLILVPLLSLFLDIKLVVPIAAILSIVSGLSLLHITKKQIQKEFVPVLIFVMIGTFIGTHFLVSYGSDLLKIILGIAIILFSIQIFFNKTFKNIKKWWGAVAGIIAGILGGMFTTDGPPLAIYFGNKLKKKEFRATLNIIFLINAVWINMLYVLRGVTTFEIFKLSLILLPALFIGLFFGSKAHLKINEVLFKRTIAVILLVTGIMLIL
ncbi:sulfite exporter TauE/SafE family protein [Candidatus Woesearchaeota archaeon]|nr:sulfite exporter TauE/SafE family protein [Candidatus Woesearchaeota archaeon]